MLKFIRYSYYRLEFYVRNNNFGHTDDTHDDFLMSTPPVTQYKDIKSETQVSPLSISLSLTCQSFMLYGNATQLAACGPNPDLWSVVVGPQASGRENLVK